MATPRSQRIGIWIIAIVLTVGTLGSFLVMVLSIKNSAIDTAAQQKASDEYTAKRLKNLESFSADYTSRTFDPASVTALNVETLIEGTGEVVKATDSINASYFGWLSDGSLFDSSKKKDSKTDSPITFSLAQVIKGWTEGLTGVKVGSVVRLTIPADKAYGPSATGGIPANSPLEFIVQIHKINNPATTTVKS